MSRVEQANNIPEDDRPADIVIAELVAHRDSLNELVASLRTENAQLQRRNRELETGVEFDELELPVHCYG